jgi:hypothetical protein
MSTGPVTGSRSATSHAVDRSPRLWRPGRAASPGSGPTPQPLPASTPPGGPAVPQGIPAPPRLRRRPLYLVAGLLTIALGATLAAWLFTLVGTTRPVLAVRSSVDRGEVITAENLMTVDLTPDPGLQPVPADQLTVVIGQRAIVDLPAGGLVVAGSFARTALPAGGQSLVGIWLTQGQMPGEPLRGGDRVRIVATPRQQENAPKDPPASVPAAVVSTRTSTDGHTLVTVSVPAAIAPQLSAMVATARIGLVLDSAAR